MLVKDLIKDLQKLHPGETVAATIFNRGDIRERLDEGVTLTDEECDTILENADYNSEVTIDDIQNELDEFLEERELNELEEFEG